jgi:tetratricopeptide (TPR) repeat protein
MDHGGAERFVGRERELGLLYSLFATAVQGRGSVVVVSGEAGIGKTRLCEEVAARAGHAGLRLVSVRCWADGGAPPLWPWQSILRALCGRDGADLLASDTGLDHVDPDRFARFAAITDLLATVAAERPLCLVVDDAHAADVGALLLVRFVARSLGHLPLAVVLTRRTGEPDGRTAAARLLDEIEADATPVVLHRFDRDETSQFLALQGIDDADPDLLATLHKVTGGNPLFLRRIAALGPTDGAALPTALHAAIDQALHRLAPSTVHILRMTAILGATPTLGEIAAMARTDPATVLAAVGQGADAGLLVHDGDAVGFAHDIVRATLDAGLPADERLDAHARAAQVVARDLPPLGSTPVSTTTSPTSPTSPASVPVWSLSVERLARRAHHARVAATRSPADLTVAVAACQAAAQAMVRNFAYEQADTLLSAAVDLCDQPSATPASGRLLLEWAQAALRCGRLTEARERFDRAARVAEQESDPVVFAEAAIGLGGHWVNEHRAAVERARVLGLQRTALENLPEAEVALRCRLRARLAAEDVFDGGPLGPVHEALAAARRCGDRQALAETLSLAHHALFRPEQTRTRLPLADELIQVASEAGDGVLALMGLCWRTVDLFHLGDRRALRALEELRERATALANQNLLYYVAVMDVMLMLRQGRLAEAEEASQRAYDLGNAVGEVDTLGYLTAHTVVLRWFQNRDAEIADLAEAVAESPTVIRAEFSLRASAAAIVARTGRHRHKRAKGALDRLAEGGDGEPGGLASLPHSSTWLVGMVAVVETAAEIGDAGYAREAYDLLLPYADLPVIASIGVACTGSTERSLGLAAMTFGDLDAAVEHLERAVIANRRLGNRPMVTLSQEALATALHRRNGPRDRWWAAEVLRRAAMGADDHEMVERAEMWRARATAVHAADSSSGNGSDGPRSPQLRPVRGVIHRDDDRWVVGLDDRQVTVPDLVGMGYLATLLTHPRRSIAAVALAGHGVADEPLPQQLLDDQARAAYADRARELTAELAEAEENNDIGRATRLRAEIDALVDQLEAAAGWAHRPRTFADPAERARTSVRKALKRAIDAIAGADVTIARHLRATIETGHACRYDPPADTPVDWSTTASART